MLPINITSADSLVTSREATREGFLKQALTKTDKANPYIGQAHNLHQTLEAVSRIEDVVEVTDPGIQDALIAAAGFSDKARGKLGQTELRSALVEVLKRIAATAKEGWRAEVVYRFLLTRGDTLGGSMRNWTGAQGGIQLTEAIVSALKAAEIEYEVDIAKKTGKITRILWQDRALVFDKKPSFIGSLTAPEESVVKAESTVALFSEETEPGKFEESLEEAAPDADNEAEKRKNKNIDAMLINTSTLPKPQPRGNRPPPALRIPWNDPTIIIACGELKGGIDPAGADEHFKTASTAFQRIRDRYLSFGKTAPALFFVGAAIERAMADEIYAMLENGVLTYAANLTVPQQLTDLTNWLVRL